MPRFLLSLKKIEKIFEGSKCPICGKKMLYSPEIGVEENGGKRILMREIPYDKILGSRVCPCCPLLLDFDELLAIKDALKMARVIEYKITQAKSLMRKSSL